MLLRHGSGQQEMRNPDPLTVEDDAATSPHLLAHSRATCAAAAGWRRGGVRRAPGEARRAQGQGRRGGRGCGGSRGGDGPPARVRAPGVQLSRMRQGVRLPRDNIRRHCRLFGCPVRLLKLPLAFTSWSFSWPLCAAWAWSQSAWVVCGSSTLYPDSRLQLAQSLKGTLRVGSSQTCPHADPDAAHFLMQAPLGMHLFRLYDRFSCQSLYVPVVVQMQRRRHVHALWTLRSSQMLRSLRNAVLH